MHRLPPTPHNPALLPVVNPILLIHLCSLAYLPILLLPVADTAGEVVDIQASVIAAAVAQFMGAALLVSLGGAQPSPAPPSEAAAPPPPGQPATVTAAPGQLLLDVLLNAPPPALAPAQGVSLGDVKGILSS